MLILSLIHILDQVGKAVEAIKTFHVKGFNITMPDKTAVMDYLDEISPAARLIGACNTVVVSEDGRLIGYNTDGQGFTDNLRAHGVEAVSYTHLDVYKRQHHRRK